MTKQLTTKDKLNKLKTTLENNKQKFAGIMSEHSYFDINRFISVIVSEVSNCPRLLDCDRASLFGAVSLAARMGLEPDANLGHFYILPYGKTAQIIIGYKGLLQLILRSPKVKSIYAQEVYDTDTFDVTLGTEKRIIHKPDLTAKDKKLIAVYAVAEMTNGAIEIEVMSRGDVELIRSRAKSGNSPAWKTSYNAMARKTVLRKIANYLPMVVDAQKASSIEEGIETGRTTIDTFDYDIVDTDTGEVITESQQEENAITSLKEKLKDK